MSKRFHRRRGAATSLRRIAAAELAAANRALAAHDGDAAAAIHKVRQQLKRLRALIRLARGHFGDFAEENRRFRDLGRRLAHLRDADVLGETLAAIAGRAGIELPPGFGDRLLAQAAGARPAGEPLPAVLAAELARDLERAGDRAEGWRFSARGFDLVGDGLARSYRQMRAAGLAAQHAPGAASLHEWRKMVKHHTAQLELLTAMAPEWIATRRALASELAGLLGEHHDLDVLATALDRPDPADPTVMALRRAIDERGAALETAAFRLGDLLAAEDPEALRRQLAAFWRAWRR